MQTFNTQHNRTKRGLGIAFGTIGAAALLSVASVAYCDEPLSMAPPVQSDWSQTQSTTPADVSADNVFNWSEVPQNQQVPITRGVFDQGGYQLFDTAGETIVIPFTNDNLYVMKFAVSDTGSMYFINTGGAPILYVPENGYLENEAVPGAKWYPFTPDFQPATPVFLGCAPSWPVFVSIGWYPNMCTYGGYWCNGPAFSVGAVCPTVGLFIQFGGERFTGWAPYQTYCGFHPAPYTIHIVNRNVYTWAKPTYASNRVFADGWSGNWQNHPAAAVRVFNGAGHTAYTSNPSFSQSQAAHPAAVDNNAWNAKPSAPASRIFLGARVQPNDANGGFQSDRSAGNQNNSEPARTYSQPAPVTHVFMGAVGTTDRQPSAPQISAAAPNAPQRYDSPPADNHSSQAPSQPAGSGDHGSSNDNRWSR